MPQEKVLLHKEESFFEPEIEKFVFFKTKPEIFNKIQYKMRKTMTNIIDTQKSNFSKITFGGKNHMKNPLLNIGIFYL